MKKLLSIITLLLIGVLFSGCPRAGSIHYKTIKTAQTVLFSFNENGIFPYLEEFNRNELGISVVPDSIFEAIELAQNYSLSNQVFAMSDPNEIIFTNSIEALNVTTLYNFDENHLAGSNVNDILLFLNSMGDTSVGDINNLSSVSHLLKFSIAPENDTLQFEVSGQITNEGEFNLKTALVILK
jgi:hypothetical protein